MPRRTGEAHTTSLLVWDDSVLATGVYYGWVRTRHAARDFERDFPELTDPPGYSL